MTIAVQRYLGTARTLSQPFARSEIAWEQGCGISMDEVEDVEDA